MLKYIIKSKCSAVLVLTTEHIYGKTLSAVQMNEAQKNDSKQQLELGKDAFSHQPYSILYSIGWVMALEENDGKVSISGKTITNLRFANGIDVLVEKEQELDALVESLYKICARYEIDVSA